MHEDNRLAIQIFAYEGAAVVLIAAPFFGSIFIFSKFLIVFV